jgi:hypothetical protein
MVSGNDEFIEIANGLNENKSLGDWSLIIDGTQVTLPEYTLGPDPKVRVHLSRRNRDESGLFLDSTTELNDTAGDIILRDDAGNDVVSLGYKVEPDGSTTYTLTSADGEKAVIKEKGKDNFVTQKTSGNN